MAPALIPPTVTAVGANHSGLSDATKPVLTETSKSIKETVNSDDTILGVPKWALVAAAGGVVALGLAYYVLSAPDDSSNKKPKRKKDKLPKNKADESKISSTKTTPEKVVKSPKKDETKVSVEDVGEEDEEPVCFEKFIEFELGSYNGKKHINFSFNCLASRSFG